MAIRWYGDVRDVESKRAFRDPELLIYPICEWHSPDGSRRVEAPRGAREEDDFVDDTRAGTEAVRVSLLCLKYICHY